MLVNCFAPSLGRLLLIVWWSDVDWTQSEVDWSMMVEQTHSGRWRSGFAGAGGVRPKSRLLKSLEVAQNHAAGAKKCPNNIKQLHLWQIQACGMGQKQDTQHHSSMSCLTRSERMPEGVRFGAFWRNPEVVDGKSPY